MAARLVSYSKATPEFEAEGLTDLQELIAFCANVRYSKCVAWGALFTKLTHPPTQ